jgi:hypothetical protein
MTTRTHFAFRVDTWTPDGESIVEHIAGVEDGAITLRQGAPYSSDTLGDGADGGAMKPLNK